jgi:hypothetical protein
MALSCDDGGQDKKVCVTERDTSGVKFVWLSILLCEKASGAARSASSTTTRLPNGSFQRPFRRLSRALSGTLVVSA